MNERMNLTSFGQNYQAGSWNQLTDTTSLSGDPLRGSTITMLNSFLSNIYGKDCLKNVDEFFGVVLYQLPRTNPSAEHKGSQMETDAGKSAPYDVYKVYIPELECRPMPASYTDPIIGTYKDVRASANLLMSLGEGTIVKVRFADLGTMSDPTIVSAEGAIAGAVVPALRSDLSLGFAGGDQSSVGSGVGTKSGATDTQKDVSIDQESPQECPSGRGCKPKVMLEIPGPQGKPNYRSNRIRSYAQLKYFQTTFGIRTIINLAADAVWKQKDSRSGPSGPCGLAVEDQRDGGCCDPGSSCGAKCPGSCEALWARNLGMRYIFKPIGGRPPKNWPEIFTALKGGNCLVHCVAGTDRTGAVVGRWMRATSHYYAGDDDAILKYVRTTGAKRGGDWDKKNRRLKEWMLEGRFEGPELPNV